MFEKTLSDLVRGIRSHKSTEVSLERVEGREGHFLLPEEAMERVLICEEAA